MTNASIPAAADLKTVGRSFFVLPYWVSCRAAGPATDRDD
jgi:hypothetical protein